jgi:hypothetical protein
MVVSPSLSISMIGDTVETPSSQKKSSSEARRKYAEAIHNVLATSTRPIMWRDTDRYFPPEVENFEELIRRAEEALADEPDDSSYELGGVMVRREQGHLDVYVYLGDILLDS